MKTIIKYLTILALLSASAWAVPAKPNTPVLLNDSGDSAFDNITNTITFTGTKGYYDVIKVYRNGIYTNYSDSTYGTTYSITVYPSAEGAATYTVTADDGTGESVQSDPTSSIVYDITSPTVTISLDSSSDTGVIGDDRTNDTTPTMSGTVDEESSVTIDGVTYTNVTSIWSHTIINTPLNGSAYGTSNYVSVSATDIAGNSNSDYIYIDVDTSASISIDSITPQIQTNYDGSGEFLADGIGVNISSDIEYGNARRILINGIEYNFDNTSYLFIKNSDLSLAYGTNYDITSKAGLTDDAGNIAVVVSYNAGTYAYDDIGNDSSSAKPITVGTTENSNLFDATDVDYFLLKVPVKGKLSISAGAHTVKLKNLYSSDMAIQPTTVVEEGSYLIEVSSNLGSSGDYSLITSITEYSDEVELSATPSAIIDAGFSVTNYSSFLHIDGDILYTGDNSEYRLSDSSAVYLSGSSVNDKFVVKDGNVIYVSGSTLYIQNVLNSQSIDLLLDDTYQVSAESISVIDNTAYVLMGTAVERYDITDYSSITKNPTDIALPTNQTTYDEILAHQDGTDLYIYAKDSNGVLYLFDATNPASVTTLKVYNKYIVNDFAIDNGLLFVSTAQGYVYVYDIKTDPSTPRQLLMFATLSTPNAIDAHGGKLYVNESGTIRRYNLDFDFDDSMPTNSYELSKVEVNSNISINKFTDAGNVDVDIFRIDTQYFGDLSFTTLNVDSTDLTITVDDNSDFSSPLVTNTDVKNLTLSAGLTNLAAGTYYVKLSTTDTTTFDDYNLTTTFTKVDTEVDKLLNIAINKPTPISLDSNTTVTIDNANDIDLYKIVIPSDGELTLTPTTTTVSLVSASIDSVSSYATLSADIDLSAPIKAGIYYVKASGASGSFENTFTSYNSLDEYNVSLSVSNINTLYTATTNSIDIEGSLINSARATGIGRLAADNFLPLSSKNYLSQVSDGEYIYALYKDRYSFDGGTTYTTTIGVDKFKYLNDSKVVLMHDELLPVTVTVGGTFSYDDFKLKYADGNLYIYTEDGWFAYDGSNYTISTTLFLDVNYEDFEIFDGKTYAVTGYSVEIVGTDTVNYFSNIESIEVIDGIVYVGSTDSGIRALDISTLELVKEINNIKSITSLESIGNNLYVLENSYDDLDNLISSDLKTLDIERDFANDFANAKRITNGESLSAMISSATDQDYFKINLDYTGSIDTTLTSGTCQLYSSSDLVTEVGIGCDSGVVASGTYYLKVSNGTATSYNISASTTPKVGDQQDNTRFYNGLTTNIADQSTESFSGDIDNTGDIDMFKISLDTVGLVDLSITNATAVVVYENGLEVPTSAGGEYKIENSGEYFIKVTGVNGNSYTVDATFTTVLDDKYIDKAVTENEELSSLAANGSSSKIISSGKYVYMIDDVDGLSIIDMSNPKDPTILSRLNMKGTPIDLDLEGSILYVALDTDGLAIIDVTDPNMPYLYSQQIPYIDIESQAGRINPKYVVVKGNHVFLSNGHYSISKFDVVTPTSLIHLSTSGWFDVSADSSILSNIIIENGNIVVGSDLSVEKVDENFTSLGKNSANAIIKLVSDGEYLFAADENQTIHILNLADLSDTGKTISLTDTRADSNITSAINDMYVNNKILYISKSYGYETVEYADLNNTATSAFGSDATDAVNGITISNGSLVFAKNKNITVTEVTPDYADTITAQTINTIDMSVDLNSTQTSGQFSNSSDIDSFHYINNYYTGTLNVTVTAQNTVNITLYNSDGTVLGTAEDTISKVVNADDVYIQVESKNGDLDSYTIEQTYEIDGEYDLLDDSFTYEQITQGSSINGNLYVDGADKDYYELSMTERGTINFSTNDDNKTKVTLLYKSGTVIASNYDEETQTLETEFKADLSTGNYMILVENFEPSLNEPAHDYTIDTSFSITGEVIMDSGASKTPLSNIASFSYVDRHSYMLKDGKLSRMSNILQPMQEVEATGFDDNESVYKIFAYNDGNQEKVYISRVDLADNTFNKVAVYRFDNLDGLYLDFEGQLSELTDEEIMYIDEYDYAYYYDEDSLYIASYDTEIPEQLAIENLEIVKVKGNYMYLVTNQDVRIVDVSDKTDVNNAKTLSTISIDNAKSIFVDKNANRLFIGANNKVIVYNISDKERVELLSEFTIGFNEKDLWYEGTPSSMYLLDDKLYTTVEGVGIVVFSIDEFNELSISIKALNLGENLSNVYTFSGGAINYVVQDELKVYFLSDELLDADTAATYTITSEASINEGSSMVEGCFIATAAYGSYFEDEVKVLRDFRDEYLKTNSLGQVLVDVYYELSPPIARSISESEVAKSIVRAVLTPIVYIIKYPALFAVIMFMLFVLAYKNISKKSTKLGSIQ